jgi:hypothetical protein
MLRDLMGVPQLGALLVVPKEWAQVMKTWLSVRLV